MGMEGGICWVYLADAEDSYGKLYAILPWGVTRWDHYYDDPWDNGMGHDFFMDEIPGNTMSATWYTNQDVCLEDIRDICDPELYQFIVDDWCSDEITMRELLTFAKEKFPFGQRNEYAIPEFNIFYGMLLDSYSYMAEDSLPPMLSMSIRDWYNEVRSCCHILSDGRIKCGSIETWT